MRKTEKVSKLDTENGGQNACVGTSRTPSPTKRKNGGTCGDESSRTRRGGESGKLRERISDLLLLLGAAMLVLGAFLIWLPAGFFMAGGVLLLLGWLIGAEESGGGDAD